MNLSKIVKNISFNGNSDNREISYIAHDSRKVKEGTLFIAIAGQYNDGHDYIFDAIKKGAVAVIANGRSPQTDKVPILQVKNPRKAMSKIAANFYNNPSKDVNIIGVTGTNGKTTTTQLINHILTQNKKNSSSLGTLGFTSSAGIISTGFTTPESIDLHQIIRTMVDGGIKHIPMEISSHAIEFHRTDDIHVNMAIFTNLSKDHMDLHKNMDNYFNTKLKLFKNLNKNSIAILNGDDFYFKKITNNIKCKYLSYGFKKHNSLQVTSLKQNINETFFKFKYEGETYKMKSSLIGKFNIYNMICSILSCINLGISIDKIIDSLNLFKYVPGRMEIFKLINNNYAIVDYAHTPDAYDNIFQTIKDITNKNIITIFGCGGQRDKTKRPEMAAIAEKHSSFTYITNDNPRYENEDSIIKDIISGFKGNNYKIIKNREEAIKEALKSSKNSILAILGKGRDDYQIIGDNKIFHSDINILKENK